MLCVNYGQGIAESLRRKGDGFTKCFSINFLGISKYFSIKGYWGLKSNQRSPKLYTLQQVNWSKMYFNIKKDKGFVREWMNFSFRKALLDLMESIWWVFLIWFLVSLFVCFVCFYALTFPVPQLVWQYTTLKYLAFKKCFLVFLKSYNSVSLYRSTHNHFTMFQLMLVLGLKCYHKKSIYLWRFYF